MKTLKILFFFCILFFSSPNILSQELIIGEERIEPGIVLIFEGAVKDVVIPKSNNLSVEETNVHIEARVNWDSLNIPDGTPAGGFVPFLKISSVILNQSTGLKTFVDLTPHINLIDNFHYARNIALPGKVDDLYTVEVLKSYSLEKGVDDSKWNLMTGEKKQIYDLARKSFLVAKKIHNEQNHGMIHTENFVLVDKEKRIRGYYDGTNIEEMDRLLDDIKILLDSYESS